MRWVTLYLFFINSNVCLHLLFSPHRNCIVWVMRNPSKAPQLGQLEALVMECANEADVRDIYRKFLEVGKYHLKISLPSPN